MTDNEKKLLEALEAVVCEIAENYTDDNGRMYYDKNTASNIRIDVIAWLQEKLAGGSVLAILDKHYPEQEGE